MNTYIKTTNNQYPITELEIKQTFHNISFPNNFVFDGYSNYRLVFANPKPSFNSITQQVVEITPSLTDKGHYEQQWDIIALDSTTIATNTTIAAANLQLLKDNKWNAIKAERDRRLNSGGYKVGTKWYHSDTFSRTQQLALSMMGSSIPSGILWKTMDGSFVTMTQTLAGQIFAAAASSDVTIFGVAETKKQEMLLLENPVSYDVLSGWPVCFGE